MKRILTFALVLGVMFFGALLSFRQAYADDCPDGQVKTSILGNGGCYEAGEGGEGIFNVLAIVLNVLTAGVGVAGVLGIVISGIQYMTASGNEAQMTKAKNRIIQVVIGLVMYGLFWALLEWLLPGGVL